MTIEPPRPAFLTALDTAQSSYATRNPSSAKAYERATDHLPGGGTRSSIFIHPFPLFIEKGEGCELTDLDGHVYKDFVSDFTSGIYGKSNPLIREAIVTALDNGLQLGAHSTSEAHLASLLCARFPSLDLVRFANSGTEANILAITTSLRYTKRKNVVVFEDGYHGSVLSHFELGGANDGGEHDMKVPFDYLVCPYNNILETERLIKQHAAEIGAILVEPMLGAGGCIPGDVDFLRYLRRIATEIDAVLIFDEVQTARLSTGGRQKLLDIIPDMTTLGKFFGGGFAFGAFGGKGDIMQMFDARSPHAVSHGGTFNNSPLTMAAGAVAAEKILTEEALAELNALGDWLRDSVNEAFNSKSLPFKMTGLGSLNQIHCTLPSKLASAGLTLLFYKLLEKGYWIAQRGLISLSFAISREDVEGFVEAVIASAQEVAKL
ncbi:hypothetical protein CI109_105679 [Kwoniella shandongensis]|uniref:Uncharacterized protein n=1 Tax=Kwoniella shandongensis TaxID=1734106 RepID=A0A5M6C037_9TREE|nr:uncharacterized protein CI109_003019 [Kwoniella shandongensis]KAA5528487.1 hypothetical protein CI109_003019 [Kwoniella shandongensis]